MSSYLAPTYSPVTPSSGSEMYAMGPPSHQSMTAQEAYQIRAQDSYASVSRHASVSREPIRELKYSPKSVAGTYLMPSKHNEPEAFLAPQRPITKFIGSAKEVQEYVEQAFEATTDEKLPANMAIHVLDDAEFDKAHIANDGIPSKSVQGFSINRNGKGVNEIFVRANQLDSLMLTIGHEIGHVLTPSLPNEADEEAKAFAFSLAWMETIREKNIAGIASCIAPNPAQNGIHDVGFEFVQKLVKEGKTAVEAFKQLANGAVSVTKQVEVITLED